MIDFDIVAYVMLGLSLSVSAVQIGSWLLNANPRALLNAGRWSTVALGIATPLVLLWLVISGRSTLAMMLAAFALPVLLQSARHWRGLFGSLSLIRRDWLPMAADLNEQSRPRDSSRSHSVIDPALAEQCAALLKAYLEQSRSRVEREPRRVRLPAATGNGSGNGLGRRMSAEEAWQVLGLEPDASRRQIAEAHARLEQKLDPELGGTHYLAKKIDEARDILLGK